MLSWIVLAVFSFFAGILTFLAPCSLPLIPAYVATMLQDTNKKTMLRMLLFGAGFISLFVLLGFTAAGIGKLALVYKRYIIVASSMLFIGVGVLTIFGITLSQTRQTRVQNSGAFLFGALFGLTWTGCIGPVLGLMLILAANAQTFLIGGLLLLLYAIGLLTPLLVLTYFIEKLPHNGRVWKILKGKIYALKFFHKTMYIHSTNLVAGLLFIIVGLLMLINVQFSLVSLFPYWLTEWTFDVQQQIVNWIRI